MTFNLTNYLKSFFIFFSFSSLQCGREANFKPQKVWWNGIAVLQTIPVTKPTNLLCNVQFLPVEAQQFIYAALSSVQSASCTANNYGHILVVILNSVATFPQILSGIEFLPICFNCITQFLLLLKTPQSVPACEILMNFYVSGCC